MVGTTAIFVALGGLRPYAHQNIEMAADWCRGGQVVVLGDRAGLKGLPSGIDAIHIETLVPKRRRETLQGQLRARGTNTRWRNGYWLSILMRFEALRRFGEASPETGSMFHIENDVATFLSDSVVSEISKTSKHGVRVPFLDAEQGCAGILWAQDGRSLSETCAYVVESVASGAEKSDMFALGTLGRRGIIGQLPVRFEDPEVIVGAEPQSSSVDERAPHVVFDSVVVGQYLLGSDPRNSQGISIPGYRYVKGGFDPGQLANWRIEDCADGQARVVADDLGGPVAFAALHIHAKRTIPAVVRESSEWSRILDWANQRTRPHLDVYISKIVFWKLFVRLSPVKQWLIGQLKRSKQPNNQAKTTACSDW